jgi:hypothetical protein
MSTWFRRQSGQVLPGEEKDNKDDDIEFKPEKLKEDITKDFDTKLTEFQKKQEDTLKPLLTMAENLEKDRLEREKKAKEATEKKNREENEITNEDFLLDSADATRRIVQQANTPIVTVTKMMLAKSNLRDTMEGKPYYAALKAKVDAMVAQQSLDNQCRADVVENCYKAIVFDHMEEIKEGKIKAQTSSMSFEQGGTGGHSGGGKDESTETMTDDEVKAAAAMGIKKEDWIKSRKELTYV